MYKGTISSLYDNPFKLNIQSQELPFGFMHKIKNEVYVLSDQGKRKISIKIESDQEILYIKTGQLIVSYDIDKLKVKSILKNVTIKKTNESEFYDLMFDKICF
jgi:hypothetical protein